MEFIAEHSKDATVSHLMIDFHIAVTSSITLNPQVAFLLGKKSVELMLHVGMLNM